MKKIIIFVAMFAFCFAHAEDNKSMYERFKSELKSNDIIKNPILEQMDKDTNNKKLSDNGIYYLVSFSMPDSSIKESVDSARKYNIPVFINGLIDNDMKITVAKFMKLFPKDSQGGMAIDPNKFNEFGIKAVPTLIVKCDKGVDKLSGNIPLEQALEKVSDEGDCRESIDSMLEVGRGKNN